MWDCHLGLAIRAKQRAVLSPSNLPPIHSAPYLVIHNQWDIKHKEAAWIERAGNAEPAITVWASPIVLVQINYNTFSYSDDFRRLHTVTIRDCYTLAWMDECVDGFGKASIVPIPDASPGFWQAKMDGGKVDKLSLILQEEFYGYTKLTFRTKIAHAKF